MKLSSFYRKSLLVILFYCDMATLITKGVKCENLSNRTEVFCRGPLLHTVQMAKIFEDSKTFVDMKMKYRAEVILQNFTKFMNECKNQPNQLEVKTFVYSNFETNAQEFEDWIPEDWKDHPRFLDDINSSDYQIWACELNKAWKKLGRKIKSEVYTNKHLYSIICVPNPVIVPGGRFREFYYWDSYWIIKGLLLSEMYLTAKGMLENYLYIIEKFGFIPNGGRIYYLDRSQPPLFIPMVKNYFDATNDLDFIKKSISTLEKEFTYWMGEHLINVTLDDKNYTLAVYRSKSSEPRPESYMEDVESAHIFNNEEDKQEFYGEIRSGAESGIDFSSRWFINNRTNKGNLTNIKTKSIVPVDLNSFIYWNAVILSEFYDMLENKDKAVYYEGIAKKLMEAVNAVLWHEEAGVWLDYDLLNKVKRDYFYPSNVAPLWSGCYDKSDENRIVNLVLRYLENKHIFNFPGGVPSSTEHTGEQWDYPNAWPPWQDLIISGLRNTDNVEAQKLAKELATKWLASNYMGFTKTGFMYEKYDAVIVGQYGGGGEYKVQTGFGWTNALVLNYIKDYFSN